MSQEATMICLDNSDYMRNGDFTPTRMEAQHDAVQIIAEAKTQQNPESTIGAMLGAGSSPTVLVTLTPDIGKFLTSLHGIRIGGELDFVSTIQVAQLALKHRQNKNQQQRIIIFVGSPVKSNTDELVRLAKKLKKNNVAVDIINFGEAENTEKLEAFINAVKTKDNSHILTVPPGPHILSDLLLSSPIINGGSSDMGATGSNGTSAPAHGEYGGIDPSIDPELALAMKYSLEEERARQEKKDSSTTSAPSEPTKQETSSTNPPSQPQQTSSTSAMDVEDEDEELKQALALSMSQSSFPTQSSQLTTSTTQEQKPKDSMDIDEDEELKQALALSIGQPPQQSEQEKPTADINKILDDPSFVNSLLSTLPGVDPNDPRIKEALESLKSDKDKKEDEKK